MKKVRISKILHFDANTRLMCPNCGTISNKHKPHSPREECYWDEQLSPRFVFLHTCHRCGYTDNEGSGFTDSGNDLRDEFVNMNKWDEELDKLHDQIAELQLKLIKARELWEKCWESTEDYAG
ncbi:hypothetical protein QJS83_14855 [Bdellovibrio sp. 22V]|uniref:hypothetical protein n=1 Tax=Bdellovibrio sp. 22V TaxID=3044166 RepID=UPI002543255B|nr:hypothetical protein [Bdellovibrio sp. 22V]WII71742.1 hypothetical protein QJS83_14855 [Bdellovibrio sp. 22V]